MKPTDNNYKLAGPNPASIAIKLNSMSKKKCTYKDESVQQTDWDGPFSWNKGERQGTVQSLVD